MGGALIRGMMASGIAKGNEIIISSSTPASAEKAALSLGVLSSDSNAKAVSGAGIVFLRHSQLWPPLPVNWPENS